MSGHGAHYEAVVLGAGISGLVSTSILLEQGCERVLVVDGYGVVGGNHIDRACGGDTFDVGRIVLPAAAKSESTTCSAASRRCARAVYSTGVSFSAGSTARW